MSAFIYDTLSNLTQVTDPLGNKIKLTYTSAGQLRTQRQYTGSKTLTTTYTYDFADLVAGVRLLVF